MALYNFTVRAEDSTGAYADRQFSIDVKNTLVERFLVVSNDHAYSSADGKTWTERSGQGGALAKRVGKLWFVGNRASFNHCPTNVNFRVSPDAINWQTRKLPNYEHLNIESINYIGDTYYFLSWNNSTKAVTLFSTKDFITLATLYKTINITDISHAPQGMIIDHDGETLIFHTGSAYISSAFNPTLMGMVRYNTTTNKSTLYTQDKLNFPLNTIVRDYGGYWYMNKVNDAYVAGTTGHQLYSFDLINWNTGNTILTANSGASNTCRKNTLYAEGHVVVVYAGGTLYRSTDMQIYEKLSPTASAPRDIVAYRGRLFMIFNNANTTGKYAVGDLVSATVDEMGKDTYSNLLTGKALNAIAVLN